MKVLLCFYLLLCTAVVESNPSEKIKKESDSTQRFGSLKKLWSMSLMPLAHSADVRHFYRLYGIHKILALSIGGDLSPIRLAGLFNPSELEVVGTDIHPISSRTYPHPPNFSFYRQDNNEPFIFPQKSFQIITLRCGLCVCEKPYWWWQPFRTCAGLIVREKVLENFFSKILNLLDKENVRSYAALDGCLDEMTERTIRLSLKKTLEHNPLWGAEIMRNQDGLSAGVLFARREMF
ncbi:MAG: hypothetical protein AB8C84_05760 [Oligoflexales bacterium]